MNKEGICYCLQIILPLALIFRTINMNVDAVAIRLIVFPLAFENIAIYVEKFPFAMCLYELKRK